MDKYTTLSVLGEGAYGLVLKCRHRVNGNLVAIKKFNSSDTDERDKRIAMRELKLLKFCRHPFVVEVHSAFRWHRKIHIVFELMDQTLLQFCEKVNRDVLGNRTVKKYLFQICKAIEFLHSRRIVHRDIKPENILVSNAGLIKLCDFGFARALHEHEELNPLPYTDYVATRWYRAPELLVGDLTYGPGVDIWALGCLVYELLAGVPIFPGSSDIDQLHRIVSVFGELPRRHCEAFGANRYMRKQKIPMITARQSLDSLLPEQPEAVEFMKFLMILDQEDRPSASDALNHQYFTMHNFASNMESDLKPLLGDVSLKPHHKPLVFRANDMKCSDSLKACDSVKLPERTGSSQLSSCKAENTHFPIVEEGYDSGVETEDGNVKKVKIRKATNHKFADNKSPERSSRLPFLSKSSSSQSMKMTRQQTPVFLNKKLGTKPNSREKFPKVNCSSTPKSYSTSLKTVQRTKSRQMLSMNPVNINGNGNRRSTDEV
eukprot:Nk52_evm66s270 gene=Nk52_evmTU66s270